MPNLFFVYGSLVEDLSVWYFVCFVLRFPPTTLNPKYFHIIEKQRVSNEDTAFAKCFCHYIVNFSRCKCMQMSPKKTLQGTSIWELAWKKIRHSPSLCTHQATACMWKLEIFQQKWHKCHRQTGGQHKTNCNVLHFTTLNWLFVLYPLFFSS